MDWNKIIDDFGGTNAVAELCEVAASAVSQWRRKGIPNARLKYLKLLKPEFFGLPAAQKPAHPLRRHDDLQPDNKEGGE